MSQFRDSEKMQVDNPSNYEGNEDDLRQNVALSVHSLFVDYFYDRRGFPTPPVIPESCLFLTSYNL
jgi:hypothetical protein